MIEVIRSAATFAFGLGLVSFATLISASFERTPFSARMSWVDELHGNHRIVLVSGKLRALNAPGIVQAQAEFAPAAARE